MVALPANAFAELEERLRSEALAADLSLKSVTLPTGEVDREMPEVLRSTCKSLNLELAAVWQRSENAPGKLPAPHHHNARLGP